MIRARVLIDAGPMVAILSESDSAHESCVAVMKALAPPLFTTWIPVTEAMYLLGFSTTAQLGLLQMIERGAIRVLDLGPADMPHIRASMDKYRDLPMDFADASLMRIAARDDIDRIFTLDRRDFAIYRLANRRALRILPDV